MSEVPCNGCTLCCRNDAIRLLPGDDPGMYATVPHSSMPGQLMLAHQSNGDCIYLGERGCKIHQWRPQMCRTMDCRVMARDFTREQIVRYRVSVAVWERGVELNRGAA